MQVEVEIVKNIHYVFGIPGFTNGKLVLILFIMSLCVIVPAIVAAANADMKYIEDNYWKRFWECFCFINIHFILWFVSPIASICLLSYLFDYIVHNW